MRWWSIRRFGGWRHGDFLLGMALGNSPLVLMIDEIVSLCLVNSLGLQWGSVPLRERVGKAEH